MKRAMTGASSQPVNRTANIGTNAVPRNKAIGAPNAPRITPVHSVVIKRGK